MKTDSEGLGYQGNCGETEIHQEEEDQEEEVKLEDTISSSPPPSPYSSPSLYFLRLLRILNLLLLQLLILLKHLLHLLSPQQQPDSSCPAGQCPGLCVLEPGEIEELGYQGGHGEPQLHQEEEVYLDNPSFFCLLLFLHLFSVSMAFFSSSLLFYVSFLVCLVFCFSIIIIIFSIIVSVFVCFF